MQDGRMGFSLPKSRDVGFPLVAWSLSAGDMESPFGSGTFPGRL